MLLKTLLSLRVTITHTDWQRPSAAHQIIPRTYTREAHLLLRTSGENINLASLSHSKCKLAALFILHCRKNRRHLSTQTWQQQQSRQWLAQRSSKRQQKYNETNKTSSRQRRTTFRQAQIHNIITPDNCTRFQQGRDGTGWRVSVTTTNGMLLGFQSQFSTSQVTRVHLNTARLVTSRRLRFIVLRVWCPQLSTTSRSTVHFILNTSLTTQRRPKMGKDRSLV